MFTPNRLRFHYENLLRQDLLLKFNYANIMEVPRLVKNSYRHEAEIRQESRFDSINLY